VREYLKGLSLSTPQIEGVVKFYLTVKVQAAKNLTDGTGHNPHYRCVTLRLTECFKIVILTHIYVSIIS